MSFNTFGSNRLYWMQFIFSGLAFNMQHKFTVAAGQQVDMEIITPSVFLIHITDKFVTTSSDEIDIQVIEAPTVTDGTTPILAHNMDRRSAKTAQLQLFSNPTVVSGGTIIESIYLPGSTGLTPNVSSGQSGEGLGERVLLPSTKYIIRAVNGGDAAATIQYNWFWYESSN